METGECPNCVWKEDKPFQITTATAISIHIKEIVEPIVETPKSKKLTPATIPSSKMCVWRCIISPCDDDMLPEGCVWDNT